MTIENINYHLEQGKGVIAAITDGAQQIAVPAFVSTLCICIVFVPMFFMEGVPRFFLFVPMALAVMLAMAWSYFLSRTLVPTMSAYLLKPHDVHGHGAPTRNPLVAIQRAFERGFERFRGAFGSLLDLALHHRTVFIGAFPLLHRGVLPAGADSSAVPSSPMSMPARS